MITVTLLLYLLCVCECCPWVLIKQHSYPLFLGFEIHFWGYKGSQISKTRQNRWQHRFKQGQYKFVYINKTMQNKNLLVIYNNTVNSHLQYTVQLHKAVARHMQEKGRNILHFSNIRQQLHKPSLNISECKILKHFSYGIMTSVFTSIKWVRLGDFGSKTIKQTFNES